MTNRGLVILLFGAVLTGIGLLALGFPVFIDTYDQYGIQIQCGSGYIGDLAQAQAATNLADGASQCQSALAGRRLWTVPMVVAGWLTLTALLVAFLKHAKSIETHHEVQAAS